ncbi:type VI secretion system baseplate subunit TssF [Pseudomonas sp. DSP3-2-2]|uniref:type VI secretion system baseplate subunit TssF n=1 Tax=unclassified Pseudomonas TaxID=196821 RepID=UPI003CF240F4
MLSSHYQSELNNLRRLADEFARKNPALAPLLGVDSASDPDVERLLEGVAFLTGMVRQRLDDEFPEFIQELAQLLYPQFLQPLPCMTLLQYKPGVALQDVMRVPVGSEVASVPIDGQRVVFRSSQPVSLEPLQLIAAQWEGGNGKERSILLEFAFTSAKPDAWEADSLCFYLGDGLADAGKLLRLLQLNLREIRISAPALPLTVLASSHLRSLGFDTQHPLLPYPDNAHPAYRCIQEYFALPEKFLFVELSGFRQWRNRGNQGRFSVRLMFDDLPDWTPPLTQNSFMLGVTPVINLFAQEAHPLRIDHKQPDYRIQPVDHSQRGAMRIHSVLKVSGYSAGGGERTLKPFNSFSQNEAFTLRIRQSNIDAQGYEHHLSLPYGNGKVLEDMTLSISLLCTNGQLPESMRLGDLNHPTDSSPPRATFANIRAVTRAQPPKFDETLLWRVLSQLNANHFRLADRDYLCGLLALYLPGDSDAAQNANRQRIESIERVTVTQERRFIRGLPIEGSVIQVDCRGNHFLSPGNVYLFGCVLDEFFAGCTAANSFTAFTLHDSINHETLKWPAKIGYQRLL